MIEAGFILDVGEFVMGAKSVAITTYLAPFAGVKGVKVLGEFDTLAMYIITCSIRFAAKTSTTVTWPWSDQLGIALV